MPRTPLKHAPATEAGPQQPTAETLGWQLRAALPPLRLHSVSLYDRSGDVLWLSEGALGPDEHAFVLDALSALAADRPAVHRECDLGDGRGAVFLAIRSPQGELVGLVMLLIDSKALTAPGLAARVLAPPVRALLQRLAILLRPASPTAGAASAARPASARDTASVEASLTLEILEWSPPEPIGAAPEPVSAATADAAMGVDGDAKRAADALVGADVAASAGTIVLAEPAADSVDSKAPGEMSLGPQSRAMGRRAVCELYVQELAKLRPGGRTRRLQLLPKQPVWISSRGAGPEPGSARANRGPEIVERALTDPLRELAAWLEAHRPSLESETLSFSIEVPPGALESDDLPERLADCVRSARLAPDRIGFEVSEAACKHEPERAERLIHSLERLGSFLVLDDFTFDSGALELLRTPALRLVKVDRTLIRAALRDKLAQARIVAISQAARVLGIHCAAKHVDRLATQRWLAAAGYDFAEGPLFAGPRPLDSLADDLADR